MKETPRIVDLVFGRQPNGGGSRLALGAGIVLSLYAGALTAVGHFRRSAEPVARRARDAIAVERTIDLPPPPPPRAPAPQPAAAVAAPHVARASRAQRARPAAPAQAGQLAAVATEPVDFTDSAFVVGSGSSYAGGATTGTGTSRAPVRGAAAPGGTGDGRSAAPSRERAVSLDEAAWNCPWPPEADAEQVNEQTVVLRVTVRPDGRVERVDVLSDPGLGFGAAARLCALRTTFEPARDSAGRTVSALSPPIRVHFFR